MDLSKVKSITWMLEENGWIDEKGECKLNGNLLEIKDQLINDLHILKAEYSTSISYDKINEIRKISETKDTLEKLAKYIYCMYHKGRNYKPQSTNVLV